MRNDTRTVLFMMVAILVVPSLSKAMKSRKLDDTTPGNDEIKCGSCPCGMTCPPPPPPPPPSPPPPSPPPPPKKPSCPPPPCTATPCCGGGGCGPNYIYITGAPGDLYPVEQSDAHRKFGVAPVCVVVFALVGMLAFL